MRPRGDDAILLPFPHPHEEETSGEVDVGQIEPHELAHSQPRGVERLEHGAIAQVGGIVCRRRLEKRSDFGLGQVGGKRSQSPRDLDLLEGIDENEVVAGEIREERLYGSELRRPGRRRDRAVCQEAAIARSGLVGDGG
jgi:hypothetical protein